jgi:hypothetical protein
MVSMVATASYNGVESSTRRRPISPALRAAVRATSKIRSGRSERRSRSRRSTSTVCANPARPVPSQPPTPAAYRQRTSNVNRSVASRSDNPSRRCRSITAATTEGGTDRRPTAANRSANIPSGNSVSRCSCRNPKIEFAGNDSSQNRVTGSSRSSCCDALPNAIPNKLSEIDRNQ